MLLFSCLRANMLSSLRKAAPLLQRPLAQPVLRTSRTLYSTQSSNDQNRVQTPIQSQNKSSTVPPPLQPQADSARTQTFVQSQNTSQVGGPDPRITEGWPLYTLVGGMTLGSIYVYFYYQYRKAHMDKKKEELIRTAREKYGESP